MTFNSITIIQSAQISQLFFIYTRNNFKFKKNIYQSDVHQVYTMKIEIIIIIKRKYTPYIERPKNVERKIEVKKKLV